MVLKKGGIGSVIALMVIVSLIIAAIVLMINVLSKQVSVTQAGVQAIQKQKVAFEVMKRISACYAQGYFLSEPVVTLKVNDPVSFCNYIQAIQVMIRFSNGTNTTLLIPRNAIVNAAPPVLESTCASPFNSWSVPTASGSTVLAHLIAQLPAGATVTGVNVLIKNVGWKSVDNCLKTTGAVAMTQQTTTIYSIGPVTIIAGASTNPLVYMCPSPRDVLGDSNAYVIALMLMPNVTRLPKNHVPVSVALDLKDIIERVATSASPLLANVSNDYLRNITVIETTFAGGALPGAFSTGPKLPWSYTFLNLSSPVPVYKSAGVLTFDFYVPNSAGVLPGINVNYGALVCLYVGVKGLVPPGSAGEPFDGKLQTAQHNVTAPGMAYQCYSFMGYDTCYVPAANLTTPYAVNVTSQAGMKFEGLQLPVDSTLRTYRIVINNPSTVALLGGCGYVFRVDLKDQAPELVGKPIALVGPTGEKIPFCYETTYGNCTTDPTKGDGYIWVALPPGLSVPAQGSLSFMVITGTNGAVDPTKVFPAYIDFSKVTKVKVDKATYLPYFTNAWVYSDSSYTLHGAAVAVAFPDANGVATSFINNKNVTITAVVKWDGAPNYYYPDTLLGFIDPFSYRAGWPAMANYFPNSDSYIGFWLYPIAYAFNPTTNSGWMIAIYDGYPTIWFVTTATVGTTTVPEIILMNWTNVRLVPGHKYVIVANYTYNPATGSTWTIAVANYPGEQATGSPVEPLSGVPLVSGLTLIIDPYAASYSLLYNIYSSGTPAFVLSDASVYQLPPTQYNDLMALSLG
jgi:hypothetical protein